MSFTAAVACFGAAKHAYRALRVTPGLQAAIVRPRRKLRVFPSTSEDEPSARWEEHAHPEDGGPPRFAGFRLQARGERSRVGTGRGASTQVLHSAAVRCSAQTRPRRGPRVVGVFSYGAGNGSGGIRAAGDKRRRGPRARATEAPGSTPGPRGPGGGALEQPGVPTGGALWSYGQVSVEPATPPPHPPTTSRLGRPAPCDLLEKEAPV